MELARGGRDFDQTFKKRRSDHIDVGFSEFSSLKLAYILVAWSKSKVRILQDDLELEGLLAVVFLDAPLVDKYARAYLDTLYLRASPKDSLQDIELISFEF